MSTYLTALELPTEAMSPVDNTTAWSWSWSSSISYFIWEGRLLCAVCVMRDERSTSSWSRSFLERTDCQHQCRRVQHRLMLFAICSALAATPALNKRVLSVCPAELCVLFTMHVSISLICDSNSDGSSKNGRLVCWLYDDLMLRYRST